NCMRQGSCGDNTRQKRFEGCDGVDVAMMGIPCHTCKSDPVGSLSGASGSLVFGWGCDPDWPMNQSQIRIEFYKKGDTSPFDTRNVYSSLSSEQAIQDICGGGANHKWAFDPTGKITWPTPYATYQPFKVRAYAVTPDLSPEIDTFLGEVSFTIAQACGDGIKEGTEGCDDGNSINTDNCRNDCKLPSCGDTVVSTGATTPEVCELGQSTLCSTSGTGVTGTGVSGTVSCKSDCSGWVTVPAGCSSSTPGACPCEKQFTCTGKPQIHEVSESSWHIGVYTQKWTSAAGWEPADSTASYSSTYPNPLSCKYYCDETGFYYNGTTCAPKTITTTCPGGALATGKVWNNPNTPLVNPKTYNQTMTWTTSWNWSPATEISTLHDDTIPYSICSYRCDPAYHLDGSACVSNSKTWDCNATTVSGKPSSGYNTSWEWNLVNGSPGISTYGQSFTGPGVNDYTPVDDMVAEYSISSKPNECVFKCKTGYVFNPFSKTCDSTTCGDSNTNVWMNDLQGTVAGTIKGDGPSVTGTEAILTYALASKWGAYEYTVTSPLRSFVISFDFYIGGGTGADALYFYAHNTATPQNELAASGGYIIAFNEYNDQIFVKWNGGASLSTVTDANYLDTDLALRPFTASPYTSNAIISLEEQVSGETNIKVFINKRIVLDFNDTVTTRDKSGTLFGFGARTGGATNIHKVKNIQLRSEVCDDGGSNGTYGKCAAGCKGFSSVCGDGTPDASEACDNSFYAVNPESYTATNLCDWDCTWNKYCGDSVFQRANCSGYNYDSCIATAGAAEECDKGKTTYYATAAGTQDLCNNKLGLTRTSYDTPVTRPSCSGTCGILNAVKGTNCNWCGDGTKQPSETCDSGGSNTSNVWMAAKTCKTDCTWSLYCGDLIPQVAYGEACDGNTETQNCSCTYCSSSDKNGCTGYSTKYGTQTRS
ncbi:MAG TPA: DUF4215 domain-containing protein, partial [bacterium]|nr:DUF4215 domain-containing protein [bacterium]